MNSWGEGGRKFSIINIFSTFNLIACTVSPLARAALKLLRSLPLENTDPDPVTTSTFNTQDQGIKANFKKCFRVFLCCIKKNYWCFVKKKNYVSSKIRKFSGKNSYKKIYIKRNDWWRPVALHRRRLDSCTVI